METMLSDENAPKNSKVNKTRHNKLFLVVCGQSQASFPPICSLNAELNYLSTGCSF